MHLIFRGGTGKFISIMETMPLNRFLANFAGVSRREADRLIRSGKAALDGVPALRPETPVGAGARVTLAGKPVEARETPLVYIMLNKPRGAVCSARDAHAGTLAADFIDLPGIKLNYAGRLDKESEGLLLFSNDGAWLNYLTHPRYEVTKTYEVILREPLNEAAVEKMRRGVTDDGETLRPLAAGFASADRKKLQFILNEGKKREIRRLCAAVGGKIARLIRRGQGGVELGDLPPGQWRHLTASELEILQKAGKKV